MTVGKRAASARYKWSCVMKPEYKLANYEPLAGDRLDGVQTIAAFLDKTPRQVRYARETGALPIRYKPGFGLYAFKAELIVALTAHDSLPAAGEA